MGGLDIVTRLGLALRTKTLNDELRLADVSLRSAVLTDSLTGFAEVNERLGYAIGDRLLQACAGLLHESCRTGDTVARLEAEALLLLLPGTKLDTAWRDLLDRAEAALTRAKRAARNRCEVA